VAYSEALRDRPLVTTTEGAAEEPQAAESEA